MQKLEMGYVISIILQITQVSLNTAAFGDISERKGITPFAIGTCFPSSRSLDVIHFIAFLVHFPCLCKGIGKDCGVFRKVYSSCSLFAYDMVTGSFGKLCRAIFGFYACHKVDKNCHRDLVYIGVSNSNHRLHPVPESFQGGKKTCKFFHLILRNASEGFKTLAS